MATMSEAEATENRLMLERAKGSEEEANRIIADLMNAENGDVAEMWEEVNDFIMWEFCMEVHRATKLNYLHLDPALDPAWDEKKARIEAANPDLTNYKSCHDRVVCPNCQKVWGPKKFGEHLPECLGLAEGRKAAQESNTKCDTNNNTGKKTSQKSRGQKKAKKSSAIGNSSKSTAEDSDIFKNMTYGEINQFLAEKCGVLTRSKRRCVNLVKCALHSDDAKDLVRKTYSKNPDNPENDKVDERAEKNNL